MKKLLSVCIPSYNMEKYLPRNLDSFVASDYRGNIELIIVNDGSTDRTLEIARRYQQQYPDTIKVIDKPNGHYGSCINAALKIATAKYFRIVDADDWVDTESLTSIVQKLKDINTDVIYSRYSNFYEKDGSIVINEDPASMIWNASVALDNVRFGKYVHMHQITYLTQFLKNINYKQTEGICYTDTEYVYMPLIQAKSIFCFDISLYQYFIGRGDQSMSPDVLMRNFDHLYKVLESILNYLQPSDVNSNYQFLYHCYVNTLFGILVDCLYSSYCRNKEWNLKIRAMCKFLQSKKFDLSHYLSFSVKGCHWFKWWIDDTMMSRIKLNILFGLIGFRNLVCRSWHKI